MATEVVPDFYRRKRICIFGQHTVFSSHQVLHLFQKLLLGFLFAGAGADMVPAADDVIGRGHPYLPTMAA